MSRLSELSSNIKSKLYLKTLRKSCVASRRDHLEDNNMLFKLRSAFRKFFSTETALLIVTNETLLDSELRKSRLYIGLDLSAAFDTIDHDILLSILENCLGIGHRVLSFISRYLGGKSQNVLIGDTFFNAIS